MYDINRGRFYVESNFTREQETSQLRARIKELEAEVEQYQNKLHDLCELSIDELHMDATGISIEGSTKEPKIIQLLAMQIAQQMADEDAPNFYEQTISFRPSADAQVKGAEPIDIIVTFQKPGKLTPGMKLARLQVELAKLRAGDADA